MAGTYALANNTTLTDGNGGNGAVVNLSGKYADSIINQNIDSDNEIFYQGGFALSTNTNRRANRENSLLLDTTTTGASTITDVAGYVLQMWVFIPFFTNHGVGFNVTNWAGVQAVVADGGTSGTANINTYRVDGNDVNVKGGWQLYVVDLRNTPTGPDSNLSVASLGSAGRAPRYVGWTHSTRGFALRRDPLAALDCARFGRMQLNATGGTNTNILPSDPENSSAANFMQMAAYDDNNNNSPANGTAVDGGFHKFGICEPSLESNGYIMRGVWSLGTSATAVFFEDYNSSINVRDEFLTYDDFNRIEVRNASSTVNFINTNASLVFRSDVITSQNANYAPAQPRGNFEMVDNATVAMTGCTWTDMGTFIFQSNATVADTTFRRCGLVTQGGSTIERNSFSDARDSASLLANDLTEITDCVFESDGSNHAVELTSLGAGSADWDSTATGYVTGATGSPASTSSTGNEAIFVNVASGTLTINVAAGATIPSIRSAGATVNVVAGQATLTISGVIAGSDVVIYTAGSITKLQDDQDISGTTSTYTYTFSAGTFVDIKVYAEGYTPFFIYGFELGSASATLPVAQQLDRNYVP
jgi:hypothetical protein